MFIPFAKGRVVIGLVWWRLNSPSYYFLADRDIM